MREDGPLKHAATCRLRNTNPTTPAPHSLPPPLPPFGRASSLFSLCLTKHEPVTEKPTDAQTAAGSARS